MTEPKDISGTINASKYFPPTNSPEKLQMTDVSRYSITFPDEADQISTIIASHCKDAKKVVITDGTACVGGNTISFANFFKKVIAYEVNPIHCKMLKNNIDVFNLKNVVIHCKSSLNAKASTIFLDPPWGSPSYKKQRSLMLFLDGVSITDFVNRSSAKLIALKLPFNYELNSLKQINSKVICIYRIRNYLLLIIRK